MRKFFRLQNLGSLSDPDLCRIEDPPRGIGLRKYCPALGDRAAPYYPPDARIQLVEEQPGIQLSSLLGNNINYLIVCTAMKETIQEHCMGVEIEYLPFDLYDHRGRLYSRDYFIINPIGTYDCLDEAHSGIEYGPEGSVVAINSPLLHPEKMAGAPALFRARLKPTVYIVDEALAAAFREKGFTNVRLRELQMSGAAQPVSRRS
ncbi:imm11 family protein [Archangium sp.]|uniref:imm11 family protein n=1 Tax=Archangium sp. TaxID=1872627 RepID=UPI002D39EC3C|nr:DUF1629 domain-containing protein [Archangium sp.]HYO57920.1 DUF1629 domain-containing protein [Archangium sp.]